MLEYRVQQDDVDAPGEIAHSVGGLLGEWLASWTSRPRRLLPVRPASHLGSVNVKTVDPGRAGGESWSPRPSRSRTRAHARP